MTLLSRRAAIASVPVGAALASALVAPEHGTPAQEAQAAGTGTVLAHLAQGTRVGPWTVAEASLHAGAVRVVLDGPAGRAELELHARDERPGAASPPAATRSLAVFVRNGGSGALATREEQGLAALTLAAALSEVEGPGFTDALSTLAERETHPSIARV